MALVVAIPLFISLRQAAMHFLEYPGAIAFAVTLFLLFPLVAFSSRRMTRRMRRTSTGLTDALHSFQDGDFSMRLNERDAGDLSSTVKAFNAVADVLRTERNALFQKELLLDTILQGAPMAVILTNPADRIVYSNQFARQLFATGESIDGRHSAELMERAPQPVREAFASGNDSL